jgi:hypothetical protein
MNQEKAIKECEICKGRQKGDCSDQCQFWMITATRAERRAVMTKRLYEGLSKKEQDKARHAPMLGWHGPRKQEKWHDNEHCGEALPQPRE